MPKIIWKGIIKSENDFPTADIPENAKKLDSEEDMKKMQIVFLKIKVNYQRGIMLKRFAVML